ncbi:serine hydrolase domain-containing protein [Sphingomonas turrisvirgatae]|uniref:serine hydrolase domain-containing protein n=1 Tax=Sphingomonas turrisvirgatae TaxID=1888892 RepID=UPI001041DE7E|nr:serine hydrolase domain-containing protein [Sphingomonas turrisvirgatae]
MLNRRELMVGGAALATWNAASATRAVDAKRAAIEAVALPAGFNGALAFGQRGRVSHIRCVGLADVEARRPITRQTQYRWGSASKWLTSVAVLRLTEQKRLSLDAPIGRYLPELPDGTGRRVTLRHLLSNTSGIPDLLSRQIASEPQLRTSSASAQAMVARFAGGALTFEPGEGWDYAALNWVIVAAIVERVADDAFPAVVRRLVFEPLAMSGAGFAQPGEPVLPHLAAAYGTIAPPERKISAAPGFVAATGNIAGGVDDAMRAADGIFHGSLLSATSRKALVEVRWPDQSYALGGRVRSIDGEPWAWETGKVGGYRTHIAHRLGRSETIVIFNTTDMDQSAIGSWVKAIAQA